VKGRAQALGLLLFVGLRLLPAPAGLTEAAWAVAAVATLMAFWWVTEALPLSMTAVLPFLLLPMMGAMPAGDVAALYWSPIIFLVLGGAMVALALEGHGLHRRLATGIARAAPPSARGLLLAMMAATAVTSMLVSNTATALIMMPVALAVAGSREARVPGLAAALVLGVAYAASIGGLGTLVGSPTNAIAAGIIERAMGLQISFLSWAAFGQPVVWLAIPLVAFVLIHFYRVPRIAVDRGALLTALGEQSPLGTDQRRVLAVVLALLAGWIILPLFGKSLGLPPLDDGIVAMAAALALLMLPASAGGPLLPWDSLKRVPWEILLMFGGGLALAGAITDSGLAAWMGDHLAGLSGLPLWLLAALLVAVIILVTEFASNVATASGFMPVVAAVIGATGADPIMLAMCAALASSWGFMMPAGTGPNAIAYATGEVPVTQMVRAGLIVNLLGVPLIVGTCLAVAALI
jgi:sodium-dependent dicarboxylate transporter 2/3/5